MAIMGFLAVANAYTMRVCLNIAITQMVRRHAPAMGSEDGSCPGDLDEVVSDPTVNIFKIVLFCKFTLTHVFIT